jgi:hypothetical protein
MAEYPSFISGSYTPQSITAGAERTINWYPEQAESPGASTKWAMYPTPGVEALSTATGAPGAAHFFDAKSEREFAVIGTSFIEISSTGVQTVFGTVARDDNPATMCSNGDTGQQIFITSGDNGYIFDVLTDTFSTVRTGATTMGDFLDGYFLALDASTSSFFISDLFDGTTWDPTQYAQRSIAADPWVSMKVSNRYIYLFGKETTEVWYDAGTSPFPMAPHPSGLLQYGCAAPFSPEVATGSIYWLGATNNGHGVVLTARGFTPEQISTYPVQTAINGYTRVSDAIGDTYDDMGHTFYILTFQNARATWVFDTSTQIWHERGTWDVATDSFGAWRPLYHAYAFSQHRMLDIASGAVLRMDSGLGYDADGGPLRRVRRAPAITKENQRLYFSTFELDLEAGLGLTSGQGSDPQVMLRMSNDGGKTFGLEQIRGAGAKGEYGTRVRWTRCGSGRKRVFEVSVSDPIPWRLTGAYLDVQGAK